MSRNKLTYENINKASEDAKNYILHSNESNEQAVFHSMVIEELLLRYRDEFSEETEFEMQLGGLFRSDKIDIDVYCDKFDPSEESDDYQLNVIFFKKIKELNSQIPKYSYHDGINHISVSFGRGKSSEFRTLAITILAAVITGFLLRLLPKDLIDAIKDNLLYPIISKFTGIMNAFAGPMIFLSIVWGIYNIGDIKTLKIVGKQKILTFFVMTLVCMVIIDAVLSLGFNVPTGTEVHAGSGGLLSLIFEMIPNNLFTPFTTGNTVQMLIIGVILAVAMLAVKEDAKGLANIIGQLNSIVLIVLGVISKLIGIFLFANIVYNIVGGDIQTLISAAKLFVANLIGFALALILHTVYVSAAYKISPKLLWKKVLPPVMIAFTTCSSSAAYLINRQVCKEELGIDEKTVDLALPFGQIMYKIGDVIFYSASSFWLLERLNLTQRPTYLISLVFLCIILAMATPPVPGGATAALTIMMDFWGGESLELIGLLIAAQVIVDYFVTGVNIFCIDCATVVAAERLNTIDNDIFKS